MRITVSRQEQEFNISYRYRYEYCVLLIPVIGIFLSAFFGFFQKSMRRVLNVCAFKFMSFMFGGLVVYLFIRFHLLTATIGVLVLFGLLIMFWIIIPMYCVYVLVFYLDDMKLKDMAAVGYKFKPEIEPLNKQIFLLK